MPFEVNIRAATLTYTFRVSSPVSPLAVSLDIRLASASTKGIVCLSMAGFEPKTQRYPSFMRQKYEEIIEPGSRLWILFQ